MTHLVDDAGTAALSTNTQAFVTLSGSVGKSCLDEYKYNKSIFGYYPFIRLGIDNSV